MEVTRKNFKETLPLVAASIEKADFLSIDAEFTGLSSGRNVSIFDSPQEYYQTLLHGSTDFLLIQYGLCAFYWDADKEQYMTEAYNFYLFPRGRPGPEKIFLCQSSSLDFLAAQGFDFNKLIQEGISYMTESTETRLRTALAERQRHYDSQDTITVPEEHRPQIEEVCERVRSFLAGEGEELEIDRCNAFVRRLLFQELGTRFHNQAFVETKVLDNKNRVLKVTRVSSESDTKDRDQQKREREWQELEDAVGFSKVAQMISQSEKLVVGHNMLLDVLHTLNHFFQPLPNGYEAFKEFAHCMFPRLLDTKYMSSLPPFKDKVNSSVLQHLLATLSEPPFSLPKTGSVEGRGYSSADDKQHEAGYDAYVTGLCFLAMHGHLATMRGEPARVVAPHAAIRPFVNKLFLAKTAYQDSPYMNLSGDDPTPSREHVFHLTFPKEWQRNDINQLFSPFGPITVQFLDETSALVALSRREQSRDVRRALRGHHRVALQPYALYKHKMSKDADESRDPDDAPRIPWPAPVASPPGTPKSRRLSSTTCSQSSPLPEKIERPIKAQDLQVGQAGNKAQPEAARSSGSGEISGKLVRASDEEKLPKSRASDEGKLADKSRPGTDVQMAEKSRTRCNSATSASPKAPSRKRTSSGVFQISEAEPPPKKTHATNSENTRKKHEPIRNGFQTPSAEGSETAEPKEARVKGREKKKIVEKFDRGDSKPKCVAAFKESDSWD